MATFYLDIDDEITSAAARIRGAEDARVALVLPAGSRIATSRINFRLLAREAQGRSRRLAIIAPEASARALAASAGLPVFGSVMEYEDALAAERAVASAAEPVVPPGAEGGEGAAGTAEAAVIAATASAVESPVPPAAPGAGGPSVVAPGAGAPPTAVPGLDTPSAGGIPAPASAGPPYPTLEPVRPVGPSTGLGAATPPRRPARSRRRAAVVASAAVLFLMAIVGGVGAYVFLPTATVVVTPATRTIGPVDLTITVDPSTTEPDPAAGTIPAVTVEFPVSVGGTFKATGKRVEEKKAKGSVRWENCDPTAAYTIPRGTLVRTAGGAGFLTTESVFLPVAVITGTSPNRGLTCQRRDVDVVAAKAGPEGNVDARTITRVPGAYNPKVISVINPRATSGGSREEFPKVTQKDADAALVTLEGMLDGQLAAAAAAAPGAPPGSVVVSGTAERGEATPTPDPATLVDQEIAEFDLGLTATGTVLALDPNGARSVAAVTLGASVPADHRLDPSSVQIEIGVPVVEGDVVTVPATGTASAVRVVDEAEVRALVSGKTPAEAEAALAPYGTAEVTVWPDWIPTITSIDGRLTVEVRGAPGPSAPPGEDAGGPSASPSGTSTP